MDEELKQSDLGDTKPTPGDGTTKGFGYGCLVNLAVSLIVPWFLVLAFPQRTNSALFPLGLISLFLINAVMIVLARRRNQTEYAQGLMIAAALPLLLWGSCWFMVTH